AFQKIAGPLTAASYSDLTASGGTTYAYFVKAIDDSTGCPSPASGCASASTTGPCLLPPLFDGLATLTDAEDLQCQLQLSWSPATSRCGGGVTYAIYRSESPDFSPQPANLLTSCLAATNYTDTQVSFGTTYYYIVRAEDDSGNGAGPCGGNQDANQIALAGSPHGPITLHLDDDFESGSSAWVAEVGPMQGGSTTIWVLDTNQSHSPTHAFFAPDVAGVRDQLIRPTATFNLPAADPAILEFWKLSQTETGFDGVVLEFSVDGGTDWFDILDGGDGIPANPNRILQNGYNSVLAGSGNPLAGRSAWTGSRPWEKVVVDCSEMAGSALKLRWRYGSDLEGAGTGFWLDDVRLRSQSSCTLTCLIADQLPQWPTTTMLDLVACINLL
ncbi:MAG: hypothetical protein KDC71_24255, partial [Acidobacteria bacterium]|nr:hypothetical protein [Acidobacteriota bacterium]